MPETRQISFHRDGLRGWGLNMQSNDHPQGSVDQLAMCQGSITAEVASALVFEGKRTMGQWIEKD